MAQKRLTIHYVDYTFETMTLTDDDDYFVTENIVTIYHSSGDETYISSFKKIEVCEVMTTNAKKKGWFL